ncbi:MAG TPA: hypothetical protein VH083_09790 [Myxococcales bacterium]|jgi:hypothetical protein|nr:hypothetical protein [Myxococcales bacterium]
MLNRNRLVAAISLFALPVLAQTTTTITTEPADPPPPPVIAPPPPPVIAPPPPVVVAQPVQVPDEALGVETRPTGRSAIRIITVDALYGAVGGAAIGGGVTLIDKGNHWDRDLMVGAGVGVLAGAAYGVFESATQPPVVRAVADRDAAATDSLGVAPAAYATRF